MAKYQYTNQQNGGQEIVRVVDGVVTIQSDCGKGFMAPVQVTKQQVAFTMRFTGAPESIISAVLEQAR